MKHIKRVFVFCFFSCILFSVQKQIVNSVTILGSESIKKSKIYSLMRIKKSTLFSPQEFDPRILKLDIITIKTYYISRGFLEVQVEDSLEIESGRVSIFLKIYEGKQYILRSSEISGNRTISDETIYTILRLFSGEPYNPVTANKNISMINEEYEHCGKLFSALTLEDRISDSVDVTILIDEGPDVYINSYFIEGLKNLGEDNITREITFNPGELYNKGKIDLTKRKILESGVFSYVGITPQPVSDSDTTVNLLIEIRHFTSKQWSSEGGYFPIEYYRGVEPIPGIGGEIEWRNRSLSRSTTNFSTRITIQGLLSDDYSNLIYPKFGMDMGFSNQWFLGRRIPTRIRFFYETFTNFVQGGTESPVMRYGMQVTSRKMFDNYSFLESGLHWEQFIGSEQDHNDIEQRSFRIIGLLDRSDDPLFPSMGYKITGEVNQTGGFLGGARTFFKVDIGVNQYLRVFKKIVFAARVKYGSIFGWEESYLDVQYEKFYLGGSSSLRGWDMLKFKQENDGSPMGDVIRLMMNWEVRFPLFWIFGGELFIDGGYLTDSFGNQSMDRMKWDGGFGISLLTPIIPFRIDFAIPLEETQADTKNKWKIQLGAGYIF